MPARPIRVKVKNEVGTATTLPEGPYTFVLLGHGDDVLILCPGPNVHLCAEALPQTTQVFMMHVPEFTAQMPAGWDEAIPRAWRTVSVQQARAMLKTMRVLHYVPATRLFPSIYAPLLARLHAPVPGPSPAHTILLPSPEHGLITAELCAAAHALGYTPRRIPATLSAALLREYLEHEQSALFLSINFHGLDTYGENQALLEAAGVPVVVWCVDNPFHLLTNQKNQLWKRLALLVTDDWFVKPLQDLGARAAHLPLGTDPHMFAPLPNTATGAELCFVGRSQFPDRDHFFAASSVPDELLRAAHSLPGRQAHFGWWRDNLGVAALWPGQDVRSAGLGAELCSAQWRQQCLAALAHSETLHIVGDPHWAKLVPRTHVRPPVDYYHGLADIYRHAKFSINLTSLLLPHGLTQRHFDVWATGGFLLTDDSPGLHIFPEELRAPITFTSPDHAPALIQTMKSNPQRMNELRRAWRDLIAAEHSYTNRLQKILAHSMAKPGDPELIPVSNQR